MPFLPSNQQRQSTEGKFLVTHNLLTTGNLILHTHLNPALLLVSSWYSCAGRNELSGRVALEQLYPNSYFPQIPYCAFQ